MSSAPARKKRVALFGGSFNPPHEGHLQAALYVHDRLKTDEVWLLVTPRNPLKDPSAYAPLAHRMEMCRIMARPHAQWMKPTDIETQFTSTVNETADTLRELTKIHPDIEFIWVMGTDNLIDFHKWSRWQEIIDTYTIAVTVREGQREAALASPAATYAQKLYRENPDDLGSGPGWCLMENPASDIAARNVVAMIGREDVSVSKLFNSLSRHERFPQFEEIAAYILKHRLYGAKSSPPEIPPP
jgi:nicotinate-nucleotide adenylyltransferase